MSGPIGWSDQAQAILDAMPAMVFVVDTDVRVLAANQAAARACGAHPDTMLRRLSGEALHCIHAVHPSAGCGRMDACKECVIRNGVELAAHRPTPFRQRHRMLLQEKADCREVCFLVTVAPFSAADPAHFLVILEDVSELMELREIVPICAGCKKIRSDKNYWESVESYLHRHTDLQLTHGMCPTCMAEYYPTVRQEGSPRR